MGTFNQTCHPYPLIRSGGLFLLIIGIGLISALYVGDNAVINRKIFITSFFLAITSLLFAKPLSFGWPRPLHYFAMLFSIILEISLFLVINEILPTGLEEGIFWLVGFIIVGIHFLPMALCFGRGLLFLGSACIANAVFGLLLIDMINFTAFVLIDGTLKAAFGLTLLFNKFYKINSKGGLY